MSRKTVRYYVGAWSDVIKKVQAIQRVANRHKLSVSEIEVEEGYEYFTPVSNEGPRPGFKLTWRYAV